MPNTSSTPIVLRGAFAAAVLLAAAGAQAQDACTHRGDLDAQFCDANRDLVADTPTDPKRLKDPSTLVFAFGVGPLTQFFLRHLVVRLDAPVAVAVEGETR